MTCFGLSLLNSLLVFNLPIRFCVPIEDKESQKYVSGLGRLDIEIQDLDANIAKACERMRSLDKVLGQMYTDPPQDGGEDMNRLSRTYNQACLDLLYFSSLDKMKTMKAAQDILDHGGPHFLDVEVDEQKMKDRFKWDEESMDGLHIIRSKTNEHWYDLWHMYKKLPN